MVGLVNNQNGWRFTPPQRSAPLAPTPGRDGRGLEAAAAVHGAHGGRGWAWPALGLWLRMVEMICFMIWSIIWLMVNHG